MEPAQLKMMGASVFQGYNDCAAEALYYLTQIEGLPINHPMVVGLNQHLLHQRAILEQNMTCGNWQPIFPNNIPMSGHNTNSRHVSNQMHLIKDNQCNGELSTNDNLARGYPVHMPSESNYLVQTHAYNHISQQNAFEYGKQTDGMDKPADMQQTQLQDVTSSSESYDVLPESPIQLPDMHMLTLVSQDNPHVAQLTQELIMLLAEEELENSEFLENNE